MCLCASKTTGGEGKDRTVLEGKAMQVQFVCPLNARKIPRKIFARSHLLNLSLNKKKKVLDI